MKKTRKKRMSSIFWQFQRPFLVFLVVTFLLSTIISVVLITTISSEESMRHASNQAQTAVADLERYAAIEELVEYWFEHRDDMELIYDENRIDKLEQEFRTDHPEIGSYNDLTGEAFCALSDEEQLKYAQVCYGRLSLSFDRIKNSFSPLYLFMFVVRDDTIYFIVTGTKKGELRISQGGDIFELGVTAPYIPGEWTELDAILNGGESDKNTDFIVDLDSTRQGAMATRPVNVNGKMVAFVSASESFASLLHKGLGIALYMLVLMLVFFVIMEIRVTRVLKKNVVGPIGKETKAVLGYMEKKNSESTVKELSEIKPGNELETLADSFSSMITELDQHIENIRTITAEKERIGAELSVAKQIQADMLPSVFPPYPDRKEFELYASMDPAKEVGGDFYDFFFTDEDHLVLVIGDVSGKGIPAALFMAISKNTIKNKAMTGCRPGEVLDYTNNALSDGNEQYMFVTIWIAKIELSTGHVITANGGHEHPYIRRAGGQFEIDEYEHDSVLGILPDSDPYTEKEYDLKPGDALFVYTDGVPEAQNAEENFFGMDRLEQTLNINPGASAEELVNNMKSAVEEFEGGVSRFDDTTIMCFTYAGPKGNDI
ncbi:MAG: serine/threonine-protein phosphatase [Lachnospiraceae bacterium]|nr:serine/threonine-protein phosphatase [Lachnospiraceae bacterium]